MIKAIFSKLVTTPYTDIELEKMDLSDRTFIVSHNYEKTIREEQIESSDFSDIAEIRRKIVYLYAIHESKPIILIMPHYSLNSSYLMEKEYKSNDPNAVFESILFKDENGRITEIVRVMGRNLDNVLRCLSEYSRLHDLTGKLQWNTNLIRAEQKMIYQYTRNNWENSSIT